MLSDEVMLAAGRLLWLVAVQDECENHGVSPTGFKMPETVPDLAILKFAQYYTGRLHQAWRVDLIIVFSAMGIEDPDLMVKPLYLTLMACQGHGISLEDDFSEELDAAREKLGLELPAVPFNTELAGFQELGYTTVQDYLEAQTWSHDDLATSSSEDFLWGAKVLVAASINGEDLCGFALVTGRMGRNRYEMCPYKLIVKMAEGTDREGEYYAVECNEVGGYQPVAKLAGKQIVSPARFGAVAAIGSRLRHLKVRQPG